MAVWRKKIRIQQPATLSKAPSHIPHEIAEKSASRLPRSISGMHGMHAPRRGSSSLNCCSRNKSCRTNSASVCRRKSLEEKKKKKKKIDLV
jgi:hypothetical protein